MSDDAARAIPIRVVVGKVGLDGHDRGVKVIAKGLRDAGMEVVYTGLRRGPEELAQIALQEDADVLGLSILSGAVVPLTTRVMAALEERGLSDVAVIIGGIAGPAERDALLRLGVEQTFGPGTAMRDVVACTEQAAHARRQRLGL